MSPTPEKSGLEIRRGRVWFHAASVGELESLWIVARLWAEQGGEVILTVFSESAKGSLALLTDELRAKGANVCFSGFSPLEGAWRTAVHKLRPDVFVTSKYESWPDLWAALAEVRVPLVIAGAKPRLSLRIAAAASRLLQGATPILHFLCATDADKQDLERRFSGAHAELCGDPRWDRARERANRGSPRARTLVQRLGDLPRPWGILGSAWASDLSLWSDAWVRPLSGTVWVVPHKVRSASLRELEETLRQKGLSPFRTSALVTPEAGAELAEKELAREGAPGAARETACGGAHGGMATKGARTEVSPVTAVLVDEMGFLLELYGAADWAYVGGGFEGGVHSTIEPAIRGIPICCGPKRADRFPEIAELKSTGQLRVVTDSSSLRAWLAERVFVEAEVPSRLDSNFSAAHEPAHSSELGHSPGSGTLRSGEEKARWLRDCEGRYGASLAMVHAIEAVLETTGPRPKE